MPHIFSGKWICDPRFLREPIDLLHKELDAAPVEQSPAELCSLHCLFTKKFSVDKKAYEKIIIDITADDYYKLYINDSFVCQGPANGYIFNYYWNSADITDYIKDGENEIKVHVQYNGCVSRAFFSGDMRMGMICDVRVDGKLLLCSDESWRYTHLTQYVPNHFVGYQTQLLEDFDCTKATPAFSDCAVKQNADYIFPDEPIPTIPVYEKAPMLCERTDDGGLFYDFGTEITGTLAFSAKGKSGDKVRILCGEELCGEPQRVRYNMRCNCVYEQNLILSDGECAFDEYDYKAFRYVTLYPDDGVEISDFRAKVRHWYFDDDYCKIKTNDKVLEAVFNICKNGVKYGTQEIFVDCPQREKGQYAGDMTITSASSLWLTGDVFMTRKAIDSQMLSAKICPGLLAVTPGSFMQEIADYSLQFPILALRHYEFTHDRAYLMQNLEVCENMMKHFARFERDDGLLEAVTDKWNLVDWPDNLRDGYAFSLTNPIGPGLHNVINAFYVGASKNIDEIKAILGLPITDRTEKLTKAFNKVFFNPETGLYIDTPGNPHSSIQSNIIPAFYGINPPEARKTIGDFIVEKNKDGIPCGVYMAYFMLKALCRMQRHGDAYNILTSTADNSWYNMVREGGSTCFEAWGVEKKFNTSLCHPWASAPISVIIEDILGYRLDGTRGEGHIPDGVELELVRKGSVK